MCLLQGISCRCSIRALLRNTWQYRTACGLFDVSHMGEFLIKGADALNNVQNLFCNDFENMYDGQVRYSPMCNERGGIVDDVLIYKVKRRRISFGC